MGEADRARFVLQPLAQPSFARSLPGVGGVTMTRETSARTDDLQPVEEESSEEAAPEQTPSPSPGSRGLLAVAAVLAVLIGLAAILNGGIDSGEVVDNWYRARDLLLEDHIDVDSLTYLPNQGTLRARISESGPSDIDSIAVQFVTEGEADRFRKEALEVYNEKYGRQIDWQVRDGRVWHHLQPFVLIGCLVVLWLLLTRPLRGGGAAGGLLSFGRSRARTIDSEASPVRFDDVAGAEEAKAEVSEIIEFLRDPARFHEIGARIPRGVLLVGPPGTGKTLLARAIAGEAKVPFFSICGSDFVEMFVGVGASRVRDLFRQAKQNSPCIIFLDEIDAVGRRRSSGTGGGQEEREQTLNQILVEMDGFESDQGIILVAATNRPDVLDPALLRPGRFDREIAIQLPDLADRRAILAVHAAKVQLAEGLQLERVARATPGFSGAELAALVNEAAILAAFRGEKTVSDRDLEEARDKVRWGRQRSTSPLDEEERRVTAYHEAGHAVIATLSEHAEPVHKVTIIPRGRSLGAMMQIPDKDRYHQSRRRLIAMLRVLYAGRIAEQHFFDDITAGAQNDIERATDIARRMVCEWGMSERVGAVCYPDLDPESGLVARADWRASPRMAELIDEEVHRLLTEAWKDTESAVAEHEEAIRRVAEALLVHETLAGGEVLELIAQPAACV